MDPYDHWSRHPLALRALYAVSFLGRERAFRERARELLALELGECVLELGCGRGPDFASLHHAVGAGGTVLGLDANAEMVQVASETAHEIDPDAVHVVRGDARRPPVVPGSVDAVYAAMSITATPDPAAAIAAAADVLRPDGRFVLLDARPLQTWPWRLANPLVVAVSRRLTNWRTDVDLRGALEAAFGTVILETSYAGAVVLARAEDPRRP